MSTPSFCTWLDHRFRQVPNTTSLVLLIAKSGEGVSRDDLARALQVPVESLEPLLRAMVTAGQVVVRKVNGERVYRATG